MGLRVIFEYLADLRPMSLKEEQSMIQFILRPPRNSTQPISKPSAYILIRSSRSSFHHKDRDFIQDT